MYTSNSFSHIYIIFQILTEYEIPDISPHFIFMLQVCTRRKQTQLLKFQKFYFKKNTYNIHTHTTQDRNKNEQKQNPTPQKDKTRLWTPLKFTPHPKPPSHRHYPPPPPPVAVGSGSDHVLPTAILASRPSIGPLQKKKHIPNDWECQGQDSRIYRI